jgi:transposase InsO family protein
MAFGLRAQCTERCTYGSERRIREICNDTQFLTLLWTQEDGIYLAVFIDLYSRQVVGWAIDRRIKKALVFRALMMAINLSRSPELWIRFLCHRVNSLSVDQNL